MAFSRAFKQNLRANHDVACAHRSNRLDERQTIRPHRHHGPRQPHAPRRPKELGLAWLGLGFGLVFGLGLGLGLGLGVTVSVGARARRRRRGHGVRAL